MNYSPYPGECSPAHVAAVLHVPPRTARYWKKQGRMPDSFGRLWDLAQQPDLGVIDERWRGYCLRDGKIWTPEGRPVSPGDVQALPYTNDLLNYYRRRDDAPAQYLMEF